MSDFHHSRLQFEIIEDQGTASGTSSMSSYNHVRNSLYPTDKTMGPTKRPIIPIARKPPIAPKKTTTMGTGTPRPSSNGFKTLSIRATTIHQIKKATALAVLVVAKT